MAESRVVIGKGYICEMHRARKDYKCAECGLLIEAGTEYYQVVIGGGGLQSIKFPERVHDHCLQSFLYGR